MHPIARRLALAFAAAVLLPACSRATASEIAVGAPAPDFSLTDLAGKTHHLADYKGRVVVLEWINPNCPFSRRHAEEGTMTRTAAAHSDVVWLGINSTAKGHGDFLPATQHTKYDQDHGIRYPVLVDSDGKVGHAYGASTTPHMFVIDEQGKVIYRGAIDDDPYGRGKKRTNFVEAALDDHAAGKPINPSSTKSYGCSVKYGG
ncbi:MAG TPA: thioredoxin family protein [Thermoanaerobaculia bacterium]|nr:thioredoxin family protein [Thermoanaerobaculia bacterium]